MTFMRTLMGPSSPTPPGCGSEPTCRDCDRRSSDTDPSEQMPTVPLTCTLPSTRTASLKPVGICGPMKVRLGIKNYDEVEALGQHDGRFFAELQGVSGCAEVGPKMQP